MNIGLNSVLIFLILALPGIVARRFYYIGQFSNQFNAKTWLNGILTSIIVGIPIQFLALQLTQRAYWFFSGKDEYLLTKVHEHFTLFSDGKYTKLNHLLFSSDFLYIAAHIVFCLVLASLGGSLFFFIVRKLKLDRKFTIFRFANHWHYYFRGEYQDFSDFERFSESNKTLFPIADILTTVGGSSPKLYSGELRHHTLNSKGELESLFITNIKRYKHKSLVEGQYTYTVSVPGQGMVIPYNTVKNINLKFTEKPSGNENVKELVIDAKSNKTAEVPKADNQDNKNKTEVNEKILMSFFFGILITTFFLMYGNYLGYEGIGLYEFISGIKIKLLLGGSTLCLSLIFELVVYLIKEYKGKDTQFLKLLKSFILYLLSPLVLALFLNLIVGVFIDIIALIAQ
ncbi:hypothetical protein V6R21_07790 [Limibacter armeniacum]|uniref:hypothetical protein n=1 Tax=Limibacter armeniacum TaxID=466084 RepID=UPI002FE5AADC